MAGMSESKGVNLNDLPFPPSLAHGLFTHNDFDADQFLLERRHTGLDDLRTDLRAYLHELRNELVGVINEDYEDFIGLGMGLRATDRRLQRVRGPVDSVRNAVEVSRQRVAQANASVTLVAIYRAGCACTSNGNPSLSASKTCRTIYSA